MEISLTVWDSSYQDEQSIQEKKRWIDRAEQAEGKAPIRPAIFLKQEMQNLTLIKDKPYIIILVKAPYLVMEWNFDYIWDCHIVLRKIDVQVLLGFILAINIFLVLYYWIWHFTIVNHWDNLLSNKISIFLQWCWRCCFDWVCTLNWSTL